MNKKITAFVLSLFLGLALSGCNDTKIESDDTQEKSSSDESSQLEAEYSDLQLYRFSKDGSDLDNIELIPHYSDDYIYVFDPYMYIGDNRVFVVVDGHNKKNGELGGGGPLIIDLKDNKILGKIKYEDFGDFCLYSPPIYDENHFILRSCNICGMEDVRERYLLCNKSGKIDKVITYKNNDDYDEKMINILKQSTYPNIFKGEKDYSQTRRYIGGKHYYESCGTIRLKPGENDDFLYKEIFTGDWSLDRLPCIQYSFIMYDNDHMFVTKKTITETERGTVRDKPKDYSCEYCLYNVNDKNIKFSKKYPYEPLYALEDKIIFTNIDQSELYYAELDDETVIKEPKLFYSSDSYNYINFSTNAKYIAAVKPSIQETEGSEQIINEVTISVFEMDDFECVAEKAIKVDKNEKLLFDIENACDLNVFPNGTVSFGLKNKEYIYTFLLEKS